MNTQERIALAKKKMKRIVDALQILVQVRANNEFIIYSDVLRKQVGTSYAAHSFNALCSSLFESEMVRMCALWDRARDDREMRDRDSFPAVRRLLDTSEIGEALRVALISSRAQHESVLLNPPSDPTERRWILERSQQMRLQKAEEEGKRMLERLAMAREKVSKIEVSELHVGFRNFRDKHVAHLLEQTLREKKGEVAAPRYGHERELLDISLEVANDLYYVVFDGTYSWPMARETSERYARALFSRCQLNILE